MRGLFEYLPVVHTFHVHDHIVQLEVIPVWVVPLYYDKWCVFYMKGTSLRYSDAVALEAYPEIW